MLKQRYKILVDTKGEKGGALFSGQVKLLNSFFGNKLVKQCKAVIYDTTIAKRIVNLDGKKMFWGDYLKHCKNEKRK